MYGQIVLGLGTAVMTLSHVLLYGAIPFMLATFWFGRYKGGNSYYDSDAYDGNGCAHPKYSKDK